MLQQETVHRWFNYLRGSKRIEFLYGLLHLCVPLELRYIGSCLEEVARKDYFYLLEAETKANSTSTKYLTHAQPIPITTSRSTTNNCDALNETIADFNDQRERAFTIVDLALLHTDNRECALKIFKRLKSCDCIKLIDEKLAKEEIDEYIADEFLIIFQLAANHPAFSFEMRTQMSQILKELEKRFRNLKLSNDTSISTTVDDTNSSFCSLSNSNSSGIPNLHASPLLTKVTVVQFIVSDTFQFQIKADWSDSVSTHVWKTIDDLKTFHLHLTNVVYQDDARFERLHSIASYLRNINGLSQQNGYIEKIKTNIETYLSNLIFFSSYISTIQTLAKFFNSSLKLIDSKQKNTNSNNNNVNIFNEKQLSFNSSEMTTVVQQRNSENTQQNELDKKSIITQTFTESKSVETQTEIFEQKLNYQIIIDNQDYLRRFNQDQLFSLTQAEMIHDGLAPEIAQELCGILAELKPLAMCQAYSPFNYPNFATSSPVVQSALEDIFKSIVTPNSMIHAPQLPILLNSQHNTMDLLAEQSSPSILQTIKTTANRVESSSEDDKALQNELQDPRNAPHTVPVTPIAFSITPFITPGQHLLRHPVNGVGHPSNGYQSDPQFHQYHRYGSQQQHHNHYNDKNQPMQRKNFRHMKEQRNFYCPVPVLPPMTMQPPLSGNFYSAPPAVSQFVTNNRPSLSDSTSTTPNGERYLSPAPSPAPIPISSVTQSMHIRQNNTDLSLATGSALPLSTTKVKSRLNSSSSTNSATTHTNQIQTLSSPQSSSGISTTTNESQPQTPNPVMNSTSSSSSATLTNNSQQQQQQQHQQHFSQQMLQTFLHVSNAPQGATFLLNTENGVVPAFPVPPGMYQNPKFLEMLVQTQQMQFPMGAASLQPPPLGPPQAVFSQPKTSNNFSSEHNHYRPHNNYQHNYSSQNHSSSQNYYDNGYKSHSRGKHCYACGKLGHIMYNCPDCSDTYSSDLNHYGTHL
ncbi:unnamed protein product [Didymodactylos carnosus]|uniref:CCHC-type domain-containing protein n=1 Tax=Didymodactylos carnosus TaxID=1234261 RepID=A0A813QSY4_9BILA|nr:unnamed protein product [Didymodactylos carnosus]CAF0774216.1 unnamed protein product [Didymodactylos carnosus]CAF3555298.1 unnamed protein product [Didymodactylos carnosus]CAF3555301.1 unnamed protein product [Didymodactylos carnosus]